MERLGARWSPWVTTRLRVLSDNVGPFRFVHPRCSSAGRTVNRVRRSGYRDRPSAHRIDRLERNKRVLFNSQASAAAAARESSTPGPWNPAARVIPIRPAHGNRLPDPVRRPFAGAAKHGKGQPPMPTMSDCGEAAFPTLSEDELAQIAPLGEHCEFDDGAVIFKAGDRDIDLWIVEAGELQIINPTDGDREVVVHLPGEFAGDIDLLTRRPVVVTARCRGRTQLMRVPGARVREVLLRLPQISEKLMQIGRAS